MTGIPAYSYVRMSTEGQLKGDSLRRQLERSARYAEENGLSLVTTFDLADYGVSAYKGQNVASGALGRFLEAVRAGKIAKGSYLLVESLDRLSRQDPRLALPQFLDIVNQGMVLVTLADGRKYTADSVRLEDLLYSLIVMSRAHEESQMKSLRISAAWANKRANAGSRKLTGRCPAWLRLSKSRKAFEPISERVAVIERIFAEARAGIGAYAIARRLNAEKVPAFVSAQGWHKSSIDKILTGRAALGEFQPHRMVEGKRVPDGDPIHDYFPRIIEQDIYDAVQAQRFARKSEGGGRRGDRVSNLFTKIARCAYCDGPMRFENKGAGSRGGNFLACDNALRGKGCVGGRWKYDDFEASFLALVEEVDLGSLMDADIESSKRATLELNLDAIRGRLVQAEAERENAYRLIEQPGVNVQFVAAKMQQCEQKLVDINVQLHAAQTELTSLTASASTYYQSKDDIQALVRGISNSKGNVGYKLRAELAARLKTLVSSLKVAPTGRGPLSVKSSALLESNNSWDEEYRGNVRDAMKAAAVMDDRRYFAVTFRDGSFRIAFPHENDPLRYDQQVVHKTGDAPMLLHEASQEVPLLDENIELPES